MSYHARMAMLLASTVILTTSPITSGFAQEQEKTLLEKILVAGEGDAEVTGATVNTISADELEERQIESLSDLSKLDPSVDFNEDDGSVNIRGLDGSRVLTTIDGVPVPWMTEPVYGASGGVSTFGFDTLNQVDILKGSDSSRYGSGVLGGMLGLRTIDPADIIKEGKTWGGQSKVTYDSSDNSLSASQAAAARVGGTSVLLQGGYKFGNETSNKGDIGGSGTTRTEANPADYDQYNVLGKLYHDFGEGHQIGIIGEHFYLKDDVDAQTSISSTYTDYEAEETSERSRISVQYDFEAQTDGAFVDEAHLLGYWQSLELNYDTNATRTGTLAGPYNRGDKISKDGVGAHGDFNKTVELFGLENRFLFAADGFWGETTQFTSGEDACSSVYSYSCGFYHVNQSYQPDVTSLTFGASLEDRIALGTSGFSITPGVRFDWYSHDPNSTAAYESNDTSIQNLAENTDAAVSGKLLAEYSWSFGRVYGQWAQGFRAPTADELFTTYGSPATYLTIGNPDLEAETSNGFELGIELGDSNFGGGAAGFLNLYKNFIDTQSVTAASLGLSGYPFGVTEYINRDDVRIYGIEANVHWKFRPNWRVSGTIAMIEGQDENTGETISSIPPFRGIFDLGYDNGEWGVGATWTIAGSRDNVGLSKGYAPGYGLLDLRASWKPEQVEGLSLSASVENVFDQAYYNAVSLPTSSLSQPDRYYSESGRSFKANLVYKF
ncbi:TonB-dependent hemoglobin/transferrin/lactoferrin family receptor [Roseibium polysiphoniae]|uniref:TonB-dependent hemoglobin/transferrin/lactoferrin family receptor n=1 Tax=Roseibium polysiphoniae TaxID=2571221 RepID=A0A944GQU7_9HYPH|nr:TonB-dependent hemoglobin/transferrin/lactoferrin family receptor [Roseibium polysiphoniae]MBS8258862.1 TonB-dependent hemoglobin/transferrin/lactoferrin family receptor [Roseibium polysiphoniae]